MIRWLKKEEITNELFMGFDRYQEVTHCYRKVEGRWKIVPCEFTEDWDAERITVLRKDLRKTIDTNGTVVAAVDGEQLLGVASVESRRMGPENNYVELSDIHVSASARRKGVGRELFEAAKQAGRQLGAAYLYISAHSSEESEAFYKAMGCVETAWYWPEAVANEPEDCHLECSLQESSRMMDVYTNCPILKGPRITLKQVEMIDAEDLLQCYSDEKAIPLFNADNCHGDNFHYTTLGQMEKAILFWQDSYEEKYFVRFSICDSWNGETIGTIEMFHRIADDSFNHCGLLRIDLRSDSEIPARLDEVLYLTNRYLYDLFGVNTIATKCFPPAEVRRKALERAGYQKSTDKLLGKYENYFVRERLHGNYETE